jgi:hypothetical protein
MLMSIKDKYNVCSIDKNLTYEWLLNKHYAKRIPSISYSFGLYDGNILIGVLTIGKPASPNLCNSICGNQFSNFVYELNRLCVNDGLPKNILSYFVSKSLKLIKDKMILVSYADLEQGHNGYIYQATNWLYTGKSLSLSKYIDKNNNEFHFRNIGHYQKNNRLNVSLVKRRINEHNINKIEIANYLKKHKGKYTNKMLDEIFGYKDTCSHWFRTDSGFSFPSIDDWTILKKLLMFDNEFDDIMLSFEYVPDANEIVKKLNLTKVDILPKHRYLFILGNKKFKKLVKMNLQYNILPYPKGDNKRYDASYSPTIQIQLF